MRSPSTRMTRPHCASQMRQNVVTSWAMISVDLFAMRGLTRTPAFGAIVAQIELFDLLACPRRPAEKRQARLDARVDPEALDVDVGGELGEAVVLDERG